MQSSGLKTADAQLTDKAGKVLGITISESAATACRVQLNDSVGSADDGTDWFDIELVASPQPIHINFPGEGLSFAKGIFLDVPIGSPNIIVYWG